MTTEDLYHGAWVQHPTPDVLSGRSAPGEGVQPPVGDTGLRNTLERLLDIADSALKSYSRDVADWGDDMKEVRDTAVAALRSNTSARLGNDDG